MKFIVANIVFLNSKATLVTFYMLALDDKSKHSNQQDEQHPCSTLHLSTRLTKMTKLIINILHLLWLLCPIDFIQARPLFCDDVIQRETNC